MKVTYTETSRQQLDTTPKTVMVKRFWGPVEEHLHTPSIKITGKRFVDGEFVSDFVQYI